MPFAPIAAQRQALLAERFIDHLGIMQPRVLPAPPQPWADLLKVPELAKDSNR